MLASQHGKRLEAGVVKQDAVIDFISEQDQAMLPRQIDDGFKQCAWITGAGRVVGIDQHDGARAWRDQRPHLIHVRQMVARRRARVMHGLAAIEDGGRRPQGIIGRGNQHFITGFQQCTQAQVDQLADTVADEHPFRAGTCRSACTLLGGNGFARLRQALLLAIGLAARQGIAHGLAQVCRRLESECAGIADVQAHDVAACGFQVTRPMTEGAADLVADFVEAGTGRNGSLGHVGLRKKNFRMVTAAMMQCTGTSRPDTQPIACCMHLN